MRDYRRSLPASLAVLLLAAGLREPLVAGDGTDEVADAIFLPNDERLPCRIEGERNGFLEVRIGGRPYRIERARLRGVERAGRPDHDPDLLDAVVRWAADLASEHPAVRRAARAALESLGAEGLALAETARERVPESVREALGSWFAAVRAEGEGVDAAR